MLTYKIKLDNTINNLEEFFPILLNVSDDLNQISGITEYNNLLFNNQLIYIRTNDSTEYKEYSIKTYNRICRGYVLFNQKYKIKQYKYNGDEVYGFKFADGNKYIFDYDGNLTMESLYIPNAKKNNFYGINDDEKFEKGLYKLHVSLDNTSEIELLTKYYIFDSKVNICGIIYDVDYDSMSSVSYDVDNDAIIVSTDQNIDYASLVTINDFNEDNTANDSLDYDIIEVVGDIENASNYDIAKPQIILNNNEILDVLDYDNAFKICEFIIYKNQDNIVDVEHISFTKPYFYIESGSSVSNNSYIVPNKLYIKYSITDNNKLYYLNDIKQVNEKFIYYLVDEKQIKIYTLSPNNFNINYAINEILIGTNVYEIKEEWKNTSSGDKIHLYLNDNYYFETGQSILVKSFNNNLSEISVYTDNNNDDYVIINGYKYYAEKNLAFYMIYNEKEYEIFNQSYTYYDEQENEKNDIQYFIIYNDDPLLINVTKDENNEIINAYRTIANENGEITYTYQVIAYKYIIINDKKYPIRFHKIVSYQDSNEVVTNEYKVINYLISEPIKLFIEQVIGSNQLRCSINSDVLNNGDTLYGIVNFHQNYSFELMNPIINPSIKENVPTNLKGYIDDEYHFYYSINNINIPLLMSNINGTNLHQEYICETQFFNAEKEKAINPIIDMEKDIYYPGYYDSTEKKFYNIDEIIFDLHFRSRNLSDWKINNDVYNNTTSEIVGCDWNILDYYNNKDTNLNNPNLYKPYFDMNKYKFYQPSDLLYFLNFTDDDIFYQKSKVGKSFLRLSFFDSIDPRNQNLLSTSTIFIDEGNLYKTFINNRTNDGLYLSVNKVDNKNNRQINKNIGVNFEPIEMDGRATLDYNDETLIFPPNDEVFYYPVTFEENKRLSATFKIKNMYEASESSEGYYLYLFKEYGSKLHEKTIFMKVEFNHAGVGRTINFMQPYKIVNNEKKMLDLSIEQDLSLLKNGCKLQDLYDSMYIPIHIKYDFLNKKYYYYLPNWLTENNLNNDGTKKTSELRFNLYELKISNES